MTDPSEARREFGLDLRSLRRRAGLTGEVIAERLGWTQSKVSKIENGHQLPTVAEVRAFAEAGGAEPDEVGDLVSRIESLTITVSGWRTILRSGIAGGQRDLSEIEARATVVRRMDPSMVPGLLQTPEYARVMLSGGPDLAANVAAGVEARLRRQQKLYAGTQRFEYVLFEDALRRVVAEPDVLAVQMDRLVQLSTLANVDIAVASADRRLPLAPIHGFSVFDDVLVQIELETGAVDITAPSDVQYYRRIYDAMVEICVRDDAARDILSGLAARFRVGSAVEG
ncbi:helix-turn-helix domain-containing protein [Kribbella sp. NPDC055110]